MRTILNNVGLICEIFGFNKTAYQLYLEGFRYSNNHNNMED